MAGQGIDASKDIEKQVNEAMAIQVAQIGVATSKQVEQNVAWIISNKDGKLDIKRDVIKTSEKKEVSLQTDTADKPVIFDQQIKEHVSEPAILYLLGMRIDLKSKIGYFKDNFRKNYILSKSHNFLVSKYAELKQGFYAGMLSYLGVSVEEIEEIKKEARKTEIEQKLALFEENEYAAELVSITGGSKKIKKAQRKVTSEIRKQIMSQCELLGLRDYFTKERLIDILIAQCVRIKEKFMDEYNSIEYQMRMIMSGIQSPHDTWEELSRKRDKIQFYIGRASARINQHEKAKEKIMASVNVFGEVKDYYKRK